MQHQRLLQCCSTFAGRWQMRRNFLEWRAAAAESLDMQPRGLEPRRAQQKCFMAIQHFANRLVWQSLQDWRQALKHMHLENAMEITGGMGVIRRKSPAGCKKWNLVRRRTLHEHTEVGRQAIYVAASTDPERESMDCSHISPAVPLRLLLYKGSDVPSVLMDSLLKLLSTVGRASTGLEDLHWVLLLLSAATLDASEVYVRRSRRGIDAIEKSAAEIRDMWKEMSQGIGEAATSAVKLGDAAMIKWLQRPSNVKGGQEDTKLLRRALSNLNHQRLDDYLVSVVGEDFDFEQSTAVINVAVLPAMFMRPQPIPEQEEDGWSQLMETAESLTNKYHQLRALFENLGRLELLN
eukprot:g127.t1